MTTNTDPRHNTTKYRNPHAYKNALLRYETTKRRYEFKETPFRDYELNRDGLLSSGRTSAGDRDVSLIVSEHPNTPYLLGIEIETEGCTGRSNDPKTPIVGSILNRHLRRKHICVPDGSLYGGFEIVTAPIAPNTIGRVGWHKLLKELSAAGLTAHENGRCGLHINVSRRYLSDDSWRRLRSFIVSRGRFFRALSRRVSFNYSSFSNETTKYTALNLSKSSVAEFRFFRGTLKPSSFLASIEIVRALVEYAHAVETAGANRLTTAGFLETLKRFPIGAKYAAAHVDLLKRQRDPNAPKRARVSDDEIRSRALGYIRSRAAANVEMSDSGVSWRLTNSAQISPYQTVEYTTETTTYRVPIIWPTRPPAALRVALRRGLLPTEIVVSSHWRVTNEGARVRVSYSGGGWGQTGTFRFYLNHN